MGHYIRFIHNRDLAAENIMTACVRNSFLLSAPEGTLGKLYEKMTRLRLPVPENSALVTADQRKAVHSSLPGEYGLQVKLTQRNHRARTLPVPVRNGIKRALFPVRRSTGPRYKLDGNDCIALTAGIKLNGRHYIQGNYVEYVPYVLRRGNALGVGGLDGSSACVTTHTHTTHYSLHTHVCLHRYISRAFFFVRYISRAFLFVT
jgi:hypothetical protein